MSNNRSVPGPGSTPSAEPPTSPELERIHELKEHEFTLEADEEGVLGWTDEHTARWSREQPLPAWANSARAMLEESEQERTGLQRFDPDAPTRRTDLMTCSIAEWQAQRDALESTRALAEERAKALQESEQTLAAATGELALRDRQLAQLVAEQLGRSAGHAFRIAELEQELRGLRVAPAAVVAKKSPAAPRDDLESIRGIGPQFSKRLRALGVRSFEDLARCTPHDIARIAARLGVSVKRIRSEGWVRQARKLAR